MTICGTIDGMRFLRHASGASLFGIVGLLALACGSSNPGTGTQGTPAKADGSCIALTSPGGSIQPHAASGDAPTPMGGVIAGGDYLLTDVSHYAGANPLGTQTVKKLHFSAGFVEYADGNGDANTQNIGRSFTTSGKNITFREVCHTPANMLQTSNTFTSPYTATATEYVEFDSFVKGVFTYTLQPATR